MYSFKFSEQLKKSKEQARMAAEYIMRPISRKYDNFEHQKPVELAPLAGKPSENKSDKQQTTETLEAFTSKETNLRTVLMVEELSWGDVGLTLARPGSGLGNAAIMAVGTEEQKKQFASKYCAMAITEPQTGSDSKNIQTTAVKDGDEWILNGEKIYITGGHFADCIVVWATTDKTLGKAGIKSFVVEKGTPGFTEIRLEKKLGIRASDTAAYLLEDCRIPAANLLGAGKQKSEKAAKSEKKGFAGVMQTFDNTRPIVAAMSLGIARAALDECKNVLGKKDLREENIDQQSSYEDNQIAMMEAELEACKLLVYKAAWLADQKIPNSLNASMSKAKAGRVGVQIALNCLQLCGAAGYSDTNLLEKIARDSKILDIFEGTQQIQQLIISRILLGKSSRDLQ